MHQPRKGTKGSGGSETPSAPSYRGSPFVRAYVAGVSRKEPVVAIEVLHAVLQFAVFGLVEIFNDLSAR